MNVAGTATLTEMFGEDFIFRNLDIVNRDFPRFKSIKETLGISGHPRKNSLDYARVIHYLIKKVHPEFRVVLYFGDSNLDRIAAQNLAGIVEEKVLAFILNISAEPAVENGSIHTYNRWDDIVYFIETVREYLDDPCIALFDMDKTVIGAKGCNADPIDRARFEAVAAKVEEIFSGCRRETLRTLYHTVSKMLTAVTDDNQDYIAFLTILVYGGVIDMQFLEECAISGKKFDAIINSVTEEAVPAELQPTVEEVRNSRLNKEQTVFKSFRRYERETTAAKFDLLKSEHDVNRVLEQEITVTREIFDVVRLFKERGFKPVCISDKPDETIFPEEKEADGDVQAPLIAKRAKIVGCPIYDELKRIMGEEKPRCNTTRRTVHPTR